MTMYDRLGVLLRPSQRNAAISAKVHPPRKQTSVTSGVLLTPSRAGGSVAGAAFATGVNGGSVRGGNVGMQGPLPAALGSRLGGWKKKK